MYGICIKSVTDLRSTLDSKHCGDRYTGFAHVVIPQKYSVVGITIIKKCGYNVN